jgi:hypothetical protein
MRTYGRENPHTLQDGRQVPSGVPAGALDEALASIAAAGADTTPRDPMLRVGWSADRRVVYWDMARAEDGAIVEIDASGWRMVDWAPVPLVYTEAAQPLPIPLQTHAPEQVLAELEYLFGFDRTTDEFVLLLGFMVHCLMPGGPYILLFITGERESGKSTRARVIKNVCWSAIAISASRTVLSSVPAMAWPCLRIASRVDSRMSPSSSASFLRCFS